MQAKLTIGELIEEIWRALRPAMFRRAITGKERCAKLVILVLASCPEGTIDKRYKLRLTRSVVKKFRAASKPVNGPYEAVFRIVVLPWVVRQIVEYVLTCHEDRRINITRFQRRLDEAIDAEEN